MKQNLALEDRLKRHLQRCELEFRAKEAPDGRQSGGWKGGRGT